MIDPLAELRSLAEALPSDDASVTLTRRDLRDMLERAGAQTLITDLTVDEAGAEVGRAATTVRSWCAQKLIPGAYRLRGREWRIPRAGLTAFLEAQAKGERRPRRNSGPVDLSSWRKHYPGSVESA